MDLLILLGLALTLVTPLLYNRSRNIALALLVLYPLSVVGYLLANLPLVVKEQAIVASLRWLPSLGFDISFRLDGLGFLFSLLISGLGTLIVIYASEYMKHYENQGRFYSFLILFMVAMLGLVWSNNLILLFIFWELTSISSFLLIGFEHESEKSRKAALQALLITAGGGLALMAGVVLLGLQAGSFEISQVNQPEVAFQQNPYYLPVLLLILAGAFTKSAQFPFHFWLPGAMAAPTPVSAYLHSATMVKAGIYLLARLSPALAGTEVWINLVTAVGLLTLIVAAVLALGQTDLKRLLAYTTVGSLGMIVMMLGISSELSVKAAVIFLLAHALYKGALFLVAGGIDHVTHTRDIDQLGGLARFMPGTTLGAFLAGLSIIGFPPTAGFIAKELIYEAELTVGLPVWLAPLTLIALAGMTAAAGWIFVVPFVGKLKLDAHHLHENSARLWGPPLLLGVLGILSALLAGPTGDWIIKPATSAILGPDVKVYLSLWHGFTPMLLLSALTLLLGLVLYLARGPVQRIARLVAAATHPISPERWYERALEGLKSFASWQTSVIQHGYLRIYLIVIILSVCGLILLALFTRSGPLQFARWTPVRLYDVVLAATIVLAVVAIFRSNSRLVTVALLGMIGFSIALLYLLFGAPDLAMVQFAIETLVVILFVLVIYKLPKFRRFSSARTRLADAIIALIGGAVTTLLTLVITAQPVESRLSPFFVEASLPEAQGRNIVNVILVDFRGLDTLGEISVLALAAIGVYALVRFGKVRVAHQYEDGEKKS